VGGITNTGGGTLLVEGNDLFGTNRGLIVEDSYLVTARIRVADNRFHGNDLPGTGTASRFHGNDLPGTGTASGIFVHSSHGVTFTGNNADGNADDNGVYGIHLDSASDGNRLFDNVFTGNPVPVLDQGDGNCGSGHSPNRSLPANCKPSGG
jgi:parallel beta-helix repeat protein